MRSGIGRPLEVAVDDGGVERAIRKLKRKLAEEGLMRELKRRRYYEKPSQRKKRKEREARRRNARHRAGANRRGRNPGREDKGARRGSDLGGPEPPAIRARSSGRCGAVCCPA
jgi:small subunit ribosomal protein S21